MAKKPITWTLDDLLETAGIDVIRSKQNLALLKAAFGGQRVPEQTLRRWVDENFKDAGPKLAMLIGRMWEKEA